MSFISWADHEIVNAVNRLKTLPCSQLLIAVLKAARLSNQEEGREVLEDCPVVGCPMNVKVSLTSDDIIVNREFNKGCLSGYLGKPYHSQYVQPKE